MKEDFM